MSSTFDPYYKWLAIPPAEQPPNHYRLLALNVFESDSDVIATAADQRMAHVRSFQNGQYVDLSQRLLNELAAARICLLKPEKKAAYDAALRAKLEKQAAHSAPPAPPAPPANPYVAMPPVAQPPPLAPPTDFFGRRNAAAPPDSPSGAPAFSASSLAGMLPSPPAIPAAPPPPIETELAPLDAHETIGDEPSPAQIAAARAIAEEFPDQPLAGLNLANNRLQRENSSGGSAEDDTLVDEADSPGGVASGRQSPGAATLVAPAAAQSATEWHDDNDPLGLHAAVDHYAKMPLPSRRRRGLPRILFLGPLAGIGAVVAAVIYTNVRDSLDQNSVEQQVRASISHSAGIAPHAASPNKGSGSAGNSASQASAFPPLGVAADDSSSSASFAAPSNSASPSNSAPDRFSAEQPGNKQPAETRAPVPQAEPLRKAVVEIKSVYKDDYAKALSIEGREALAKKLNDEAARTKEDPVVRYALATQSLEMAIRLCDVKLASGLVNGLCTYYDVDSWQLKAKTLAQLSGTAKTADQRRIIASLAFDLVEKALAEERYDAGVQLAATASEMAATLRDSAFREKTREAHARARRIQEEAVAVQAAQERLATQSDDAAAHLLIGRFYAMERNDWDSGLPHLLRGSDAQLSALARRELAGAPQPIDQMALADAWWDLAGIRRDTDPILAKEMRSRAVYWYRRAVDKLDGFEKSKAKKRIAEVDSGTAAKP